MQNVRMFLEQRKLQYLILCTFIVDVACGYLLKTVEAFSGPMPLAFLYLANIVVILAVYRFWLLPVFECGDAGFALYGVLPFTKDVCGWAQLEDVCFREMPDKKGRMREFLILRYVTVNGLRKTNIVPMYLVWKRDAAKKEFLGFLRGKGIKPQCQPGP